VDDKAKIAELYTAGKHTNEITKALSRPYTTIRQHLLRLGLPTSPLVAISSETEQEIVKRLKARESQARISRKYRVDVKRIRKIARANGIACRIGGRQTYHLGDELRKQIATARGSAASVARQFRVDTTTVFRARRKYERT
jgi:hypothetical protein